MSSPESSLPPISPAEAAMIKYGAAANRPAEARHKIVNCIGCRLHHKEGKDPAPFTANEIAACTATLQTTVHKILLSLTEGAMLRKEKHHTTGPATAKVFHYYPTTSARGREFQAALTPPDNCPRQVTDQ